VRGDVPWCLACYAALAVAVPDADADADAAADAAAQVAPAAGPAPDVEQAAARMLAELAASGHRPPWVERLPTTSAARVALIAGLLTVVSTVLLAAMALAGLAL
jgi:hypothetical protein